MKKSIKLVYGYFDEDNIDVDFVIEDPVVQDDLVLEEILTFSEFSCDLTDDILLGEPEVEEPEYHEQMDALLETIDSHRYGAQRALAALLTHVAKVAWIEAKKKFSEENA